MNRTERQAQIAEIIRQEDSVKVEELAQRFLVTTQTIRRDINRLCDRGIAQRQHGGARRIGVFGNVAYACRQILNADAKLRIAEEVARHVPDGASLSFSIGTTPEIVSRSLLSHQQLRIFTNNLNIAMRVCENPSFEVTVAGGRLRNGDRDVLGAGVETLFSAYKVDIGVYGVAGVDEDGTLLDFYEEEVRARQIIRANSRASFLVLDHTKFGRAAHVRGGHIGEADKIFCDRTPSGNILDQIRQSGAELILCPGETAP
jgi:DeoR family glycerol-3-phosphate regulon repressor